MIREFLDSLYSRTVGSVKSYLIGLITKVTRGSGVLQLVYVLLVVGLMAGFINAIAFPVGNQGYVIWPGGGAQTIPEALINSFVIMVGGAGIYLAYVSGRQTTRPRSVNLYLGLALLLIAVSILAGFEVAILKGFG